MLAILLSSIKCSLAGSSFINHCFVNVIMIASLFSLTDVVQVWNSSSYCSNNVIYSCCDNTPFINWGIFEQGTHIASWTVSHFTSRLRRETEPIEAVVEVTYSNLTFIASTIILTLPLDHQPYTIYCNSDIARNIPRASASKSAIMQNIVSYDVK